VSHEGDDEGGEAEERGASAAGDRQNRQEWKERPDRRVLIEEDVVVVAEVGAVGGSPFIDVAEQRELIGECAPAYREGGDGEALAD